MTVRDQRKRLYAEIIDQPAVSMDGVAMSINLNCGLLIDLQHLTIPGPTGSVSTGPRSRS